jgi:hypothetical protein
VSVEDLPGEALPTVFRKALVHAKSAAVTAAPKSARRSAVR